MPGGGPRIIIRTFGSNPGGNGDGFNENVMGDLNDILMGMGGLGGLGGMFNEPQIRVGGGHYHHSSPHPPHPHPPPPPPPYQEMQQQSHIQHPHYTRPDIQRTPRFQKPALIV